MQEHVKYLEMKKWNPRITRIIDKAGFHSDDEDSLDQTKFYRLTLRDGGGLNFASSARIRFFLFLSTYLYIMP